jgi:hypothetical protein
MVRGSVLTLLGGSPMMLWRFEGAGARLFSFPVARLQQVSLGSVFEHARQLSMNYKRLRR